MSVAFVFPGQGSQSVGMLDELVATSPIFDQRFAEASDALGFDLTAIVNQGPAERLNQTEITQPALLAVSVALYETWIERGGEAAAAMSGHSLGEYSALTAAGALEFATAVRLVHERGKLMQAAVPSGEGAMAAVLRLDDEELAAICEKVEGVVAPANYNSPGQVVIAGSAAAVDEASTLCQEAGARVVVLDVSVPSHCALMSPTSEGVEQLLVASQLQLPRVPVYQNFDGKPAEDVEEIRRKLVSQLSNPVRWSSGISAMVEDGATTMVECGPGKVLTGLFRRIDRSIKALAIGDAAGFDKALAEVS